MSITARTTHVTVPVDGDVPDLIDVVAAADLLGTPPRFVRRLVAERRIRFYKLGRYVRIDRSDVEAFIAASRVEAALVRTRQHRA
ncbi:MAG: excisionase family DNA-binding protein [Candidatus Nanopelagicales bacterium]|uniref:excisionase family DNA-binding protein n=1 Tax=Pseudonocardia sp. TaxID=60912 RepID=UPI003D141935